MTSADCDIIEGSFRVVSTLDPIAPPRRSPNRRRAALRMAVWRSALLVALVAAPLVF
jgi:hypothetical protein